MLKICIELLYPCILDCFLFLLITHTHNAITIKTYIKVNKNNYVFNSAFKAKLAFNTNLWSCDMLPLDKLSEKKEYLTHPNRTNILMNMETGQSHTAPKLQVLSIGTFR